MSTIHRVTRATMFTVAFVLLGDYLRAAEAPIGATDDSIAVDRGQFDSVAASQLTAEQLAFFENKIRPVLANSCYECHSEQAAELQGGLRLDYRDTLLAGGDSGPAIVAGDPDESLLIQSLHHDAFEMPPDQKLPDHVIADFETWVRMGAPDPRVGGQVHQAPTQLEGQDHWAFQPIEDQSVPEVLDREWPINDIDRFTLQRLEQSGLTPAPDADRYTWLRRVSLDLTGLPPTLEEIEDFVNDRSPNAYERVVDRLLGSQAFGERWARHWFDLVGYADQKGTQAPIYAANAWRYRDYVIDTINQDLPFDHFIRQQIAGDLMPHQSIEERRQNIIATGYLVLGDLPLVEADKEKLRVDVVDLQVDRIGKAFLGLTLGCARCHDHKFDPIPRDDYYAMAGMFFNTSSVYKTTVGTWSEVNDIELPETDEERTTRIERENQQAQKLIRLTSERTETTARVAELDEMLKEIDEQEAEAKKEQAAKKQAEEQAQKEAAKDNDGKQNADNDSADKKNDDKKDDDKKDDDQSPEAERSDSAEDNAAEDNAPKDNGEAEVIADLKKERTRLRGRLRRLDQLISHAELFVSQMPVAHGVYDVPQPSDMRITIRGNARALGAAVPRGFLQVVSSGATVIPEDQSGRLQLADWIASPDNPLTPRVAVNRIWEKLIGAGLQQNVDYFGLPEVAPSHPELLDYLSVKFLEQDWSRKRLIRSIALSRTYRMSSLHDENAYEIDPDNRLIWRMNRGRLDAEALRDSLVAASGSMHHISGGPTLWYDNPDNVVNIGKNRIFINLVFFNLAKFRPDQQHHRSIYLPVLRGTPQHKLADIRNVFDFTPPVLTAGKRTVTTVPTQALFLMNSPLVKEHAKSIAQRVEADAESESERLALLWMYLLNRPVTENEQERAAEFLKLSGDEPWIELCHALIASNEFLMRF